MNKQILTFKQIREAKGYTQESLARTVGLSRLAIARYELKQSEPKLGNFLKIAEILEVSLVELALAMGYEIEEKLLQVCQLYTPAQNEVLEIDSVQMAKDNPKYTPAKRQSKPKVTGSEIIEIPLSELPIGDEPEKAILQVCIKQIDYTPARNEVLEIDSVKVVNENSEYVPAKRRAKGEGTGFIEERLVKRGDKEYKQYWFHWQKSEPGKKRVLSKSKYIPKELVAEIIEKNNQKLPVKEILRILEEK